MRTHGDVRRHRSHAVKGREDGFGRIEIRKLTGYLKLMSKSTETNLERALRTPSGWRSYFAVTLQKFESAGIPACASMLQRVNTYAIQSWERPAQQLAYLWHYFFEEFYGIGMPRKVGIESALAVRSDGGALKASQMPTTATPYDMALMGAGGGDAERPSFVPRPEFVCGLVAHKLFGAGRFCSADGGLELGRVTAREAGGAAKLNGGEAGGGPASEQHR